MDVSVDVWEGAFLCRREAWHAVVANTTVTDLKVTWVWVTLSRL